VLRHLELCSNFKQNKWITFIVINDYDYTKSMITIWKDQGAQIFLRHLHNGFLPTICSLPVPGYLVFKIYT